MEKVKVIIDNRQKVVKIPTGIRLLVRRCCHAVLDHENFDKSAEISVSFVSNDEIQLLNNEYRQKDSATDVLSFPQHSDNNFELNENKVCQLGDIVISIEKAVEQSNAFGHTLQREVAFLTVHSMFHLLGFEHEFGGLPARVMREKEEVVLTKLGVDRGTSFVVG